MSTLAWILTLLACWFAVSVVVGICVGKTISMRDRIGGPQ